MVGVRWAGSDSDRRQRSGPLFISNSNTMSGNVSTPPIKRGKDGKLSQSLMATISPSYLKMLVWQWFFNPKSSDTK